MVLEKPAFTVVDLQRQFKLLDTNGDGLLTFDEFVQAITHVGRSEEEAKKMANAFFNLCDLVSRTRIYSPSFTPQHGMHSDPGPTFLVRVLRDFSGPGQPCVLP